MLDKNLKLLINGATHLRDNGDVRFYLSARVLYSPAEFGQILGGPGT